MSQDEGRAAGAEGLMRGAGEGLRCVAHMPLGQCEKRETDLCHSAWIGCQVTADREAAVADGSGKLHGRPAPRQAAPAGGSTVSIPDRKQRVASGQRAGGAPKSAQGAGESNRITCIGFPRCPA